ncbi:MAG: threonine/serine exporter family protein [Acidaminococcaceae bacterium]|nr:threonine/serine exporter family protein [Acidaminococcaceae bacterium]
MGKNNSGAEDPYLHIGRKLNLLLRTGQMLMESGADAARIVRDTRLVAANMGIPAEKFTLHISYTTLMLNVTNGNISYTNFKKCLNHDVDMTNISAVSKLAWRSVKEGYSLDEYERELDRIINIPKQYPTLISVLAAGLACGGFCKLFGCDWVAFFYTALSASAGFWLRRICNKLGINNYAGIAIAAFFATFLAYLTHFLSGSATPWYPLIACTLFIIPGMPLINAINDMLNNHIVAGMTRLINTILIVGSMTFGIIIAMHVGQVSDFTSLSVGPDSKYLVEGIAAAIAASGFAIIFNIPKRLLFLSALGGMFSICVRNFIVLYLGWGIIIGAFAAATLVSLISLKIAHSMRTPVLVLAIPSVIPMIPGVLLYRLLFGIINIKALDANAFMAVVQSGVTAVLIIIGITVGVTIPNIFAGRYLDKLSQGKYI